MTEPVSRTGLTMNPKTSMVLLLVGRLVSIVTAGSPASGESLLHVSLPVYQSIHLSVCLYVLFFYLPAAVSLSIHPSVYLNIYLYVFQSVFMSLCLSLYLSVC